MKATNPRHGSMQFWPRKRAAKETPGVKAWATSNDAKALGFAGYKVGMTHVIFTEAKKNALFKGLDVSSAVTVIECPPLKVAGIRAYKTLPAGKKLIAQSFGSIDKEVSRKTYLGSKNTNIAAIDAVSDSDFTYIRLICYTQPKVTGIGKKKPELFEVAVGGSAADQLAYAKENLGKEIAVADVFEAGMFVDAHAVTKGKGYQGVIKRFGVSLKAKKSEKGQRRVGSRSGGWTSRQHMMYRVAQPGQVGYHTRTDYNKVVMLIGDDATKINPDGGFPRYGAVKNTYVLIKGSVPGPSKRLIRFNKAIRPHEAKIAVPEIDYTSTISQQG
jgi:large subunit ribosomal protein L3